MTVVNPPGFLQNLSTHTAEVLRGAYNNLLSVQNASLIGKGGVNPALGPGGNAGLKVFQNGTPNMSVNVPAGGALISGTEGTKQGIYSVLNDATVNLAISASDPTLNRIDIVVFKVQDTAYSGATDSCSLVVVTGTPSGSPAVPTAPNNSITLAQVAVNAAVSTIVTANITDKRTFYSAMGGAQICTSATRPASPYEGLLIYQTDNDGTMTYDGTNWHQIGIHLCTSSTRPAGPFNGMKIYETDTNLDYTWNGSKWLRQAVEIYKSTDTSFTSTTTLANDAALLFAMEASSVYAFKLKIGAIGTTTPGYKYAITAPAGTRFDYSRNAWHLGVAFNDWVQNGASGTTGTFETGGGGGFLNIKLEGTVACGVTPGNFQYQAAQGTSNATASWTLRGSTLYVKQVA